MDELTVRLATEGDYQAVVDMSQGVYEGHDDTPNRFHQWLKRRNHRVLMAIYDKKPIGLCGISVVDEGCTFVSKGLRIHPDFRGMGFGIKLVKAVREFVKANYPNVVHERYTTANTHLSRLSIATKTGDKLLYEQDSYAFVVKQEEFQSSKLEQLCAPYLSLVCIYDKQSFKEALENQHNDLFKEGIMIVNYEPYKAIPSNVELCVEPDDFLFTDSCQSNELHSLSHGCIIHAAKFTQWAVTVFATDPFHLEGHLVINLKMACELVKGDIIFRVSHERNSSFKDLGVMLLQDKLGLQKETARFGDNFRALLFEKKLN